MADYGILMGGFSDFSDSERLMMFDRKINRRNITQKPRHYGAETQNTFREIFLGSRFEVFTVYADYLSRPLVHTFWKNAVNSDGSAVVMRGSGITDNQLELRDDGWYLVAYNPTHLLDGNAQFYTTHLNTDFYVYKVVSSNQPAVSQYGLNVYGANGRLMYHSGWKIPTTVFGVSFGRSVGDTETVIVQSHHEADFTLPKNAQHYVDYYSLHGHKVFVGHDKLVAIDAKVTAKNFNPISSLNVIHSDDSAVLSPYIFQGYLGYALRNAVISSNYERLGNQWADADKRVRVPLKPIAAHYGLNLIYKPEI